jgi:hypothetical protein
LITARLEHPGIVPIHEAGRWPDGTPFYVLRTRAGRAAEFSERVALNDTTNIGVLHGGSCDGSGGDRPRSGR